MRPFFYLFLIVYCSTSLTAHGQTSFLTGHAGPVTHVFVSANGKVAVTGGDDGYVIVWDLQKLTVVKRLKVMNVAIEKMNMSPDGEKVATFGMTMPDVSHANYTELDVWDLKTEQKLFYTGSSGMDIPPVFTSDNAGLYFIDLDFPNTVKKVTLYPKPSVMTFPNSAGTQQIITVPNSNTQGIISLFATTVGGHVDHTLKIWDGKTIINQYQFSDLNFSNACLSADFNTLMHATTRETLIRDLQANKIIKKVPINEKLISQGISADGSHFFLLESDGTLTYGAAHETAAKIINSSGFQKITAAVFIPGTSKIVCGYANGRIDMIQENNVALPKVYMEGISSAVFSVDEHSLIFSTGAGKNYYYSLETGQMNDNNHEFAQVGRDKSINGDYQLSVDHDVTLINNKSKEQVKFYVLSNAEWMCVQSQGDTIFSKGFRKSVGWPASNLKTARQHAMLPKMLSSSSLFENLVSTNEIKLNEVRELNNSLPIALDSIRQDDASPILVASIANKQHQKLRIITLVNGKPLFSEESKDENSNMIRYRAPLLKYFSDGTLKYGQVNQLEVRVYKLNTDVGVLPLLDAFYGVDHPEQLLNSALIRFKVNKNRIPQVVVPIGHPTAIAKVASVPGGRYLLSGDYEGNIIMWDRYNGDEVAEFKAGQGETTMLTVSPDGHRAILGARWQNGFLQGDHETEISVTTGEVLNQFGTDRYDYSEDGNYLLDITSNTKINLNTGESVRLLSNFTGSKESVKLATDNRTALTLGQYYYNGFGKDRRMTYELARWDMEKQSPIMIYDSTAVNFSNILYYGKNSNFLTYSWGEMNFWKINKPKLFFHFQTGNASIISVLPLADSLHVAVLTKDGNIYTVDPEKKTSVVNSMLTGNKLEPAELIDNGENVLSGGSDGALRIYSARDGKLIKQLSGSGLNVQHVAYNEAQHALYVSAFSGSKDAYILRLDDVANGLVKLHHDKEVYSGEFSPDGRYLLTTELKGAAYVWNVKAGALQFRMAGSDGTVLFANFLRNGTLKYMMPDDNGQYNNVYTDVKGAKLSPDAQIGDHDSYSSQRSSKLTFDTGLGNTNDFNSALKIIKQSTNELIGTLTFLNENDWILVTPDGYYMGTKGAAQVVKYRIDGELHAFEDYDLHFNRPDIIMNRLDIFTAAQIDEQKAIYERRLHRLHLDQGKVKVSQVWQAPIITILNADSLQANPIETNARLHVRIADHTGKITNYNIFINGTPLYGIAGKQPANYNGDEFEIDETVTLGNGRNKVTITAVNDLGNASSSRELFLSNTAAFIKPKLHIIAIGADQFADSRWNLTYPAKDAKDVIDLFEKNNTRFSAIDTISLTGKAVTVQRIADLKKRLMKSQTNDEVVLFYSGHGVRDKQQNYYLATTDMDFANPVARGITTDLLESIFDGIPALSKVLLIDACQSGEADANELSGNNQRYIGSNPGLKLENKGVTHPPAYTNAAVQTTVSMMQNIYIDLRRRTGATIISSAGPLQYALEANQWQNSAFTYALKKGLAEKAADSDHDGKILLSELSRYLRESVPQLTNQQQQPTSRMDNNDNDFEIF